MLQPSHFRPQHQNQGNSDPYTEIKSSSIPHRNQVNFDHPRKNEVKFDAYTTTKWFLARIQKPSHLQPPTQKPSQSI